MLLDLKYIICSYLDLESSVIILNNNSQIKVITQRYFPILQNKHKYVVNGDYHTVKYMSQIGIRFTQHSMHIASKYGQLEIIKFFVSLGIIPTQNVVNCACSYEYFELVKYLYGVAPKRFTSQTLYDALAIKNKEIIYYLYNLGIPVTVYCIDISISVDTEIFKLMYSKRSKKYKSDNYNLIIASDNLEIYEILRDDLKITDFKFLNFINSSYYVLELKHNLRTYFENKFNIVYDKNSKSFTKL